MLNIKDFFQFIETRYSSFYKIFRYVVSGGAATIVNLVILFSFTDFLGVWYVISAIIAYIFSFVVSFLLQKYWTFRDYSNGLVVKQGITYFVIGIVNLTLNTLLIYLFTDIVGLYYIVSQIISGLLIAFISFFVYKNIIFSKIPK